ELGKNLKNPDLAKHASSKLRWKLEVLEQMRASRLQINPINLDRQSPIMNRARKINSLGRSKKRIEELSGGQIEEMNILPQGHFSQPPVRRGGISARVSDESSKASKRNVTFSDVIFTPKTQNIQNDDKRKVLAIQWNNAKKRIEIIDKQLKEATQIKNARDTLKGLGKIDIQTRKREADKARRILEKHQDSQFYNLNDRMLVLRISGLNSSLEANINKLNATAAVLDHISISPGAVQKNGGRYGK
ncbi:MAG: hypothetical protein FWF34_00460, partial [Alphaproteobacteria bacterium]|nr:hypothetical protein [Alphaproteobacteria bacterium]